MWFRNLSVYRFPETPDITPASLEDSLEKHIFQPCPKHQPASIGWTAPLGRDGEQLVHTTDGRMMICLKREERVLPAASLRERLEEKLAAIEEAEGRKVRGKEKLRIKEEITLDMLPLAFTRSHVLYAYIDPKARLLIVDSGTTAKAEELIGILRQTLGTLPVRPLQVNEAPAAVMTGWLHTGHAEHGFELGEDCVFKASDNESSVVRLKQHALTCDEVDVHLKAGKRINQLAVSYQDRLSCVLDENLIIKRVKFLDLVLDAAEAEDTESAAARFDVDFSLMGAELGPFVEALVAAFGGEPD